MNRRDLLKGAAGLLGYTLLPPLLRPLGASPWSAIDLINTHRFIVERAMALLARDPGTQLSIFPTTAQIHSRDWVKIGTNGVSGPGPDGPGNSDYSWHYYNPRTAQGNAPTKAAEYFGRMIQERTWNGDQSWGAAWSAHFLADMFVPYHVVGMPAVDAHAFNARGEYILDDDLCGDWLTLYSPTRTEIPKRGWGVSHDHSANIQQFCRSFPLGNIERVDWFDPWYWNGYETGLEFTTFATGSHAEWEALAQPTPLFETDSQQIQGESWYDPLWMNWKADFSEEHWRNQAQAVGLYAEKCAARTREGSRDILGRPTLGMALAVRGVLTLFRGSMTCIRLSAFTEVLPEGGYRLTGNIQNVSDVAQITALDVRLSVEGPSGTDENTRRIPGTIPPNQSGSVSWNIPGGESLTCSMEVSAEVHGCPDMGYARIQFSVQGTQVEPSEPEQPPPESAVPEAYWTWDGDWSVEIAEANNPSNTAGPWVMRISTNGRSATARWITGPTAADPPVPFLLDQNGCLNHHSGIPGGSSSDRITLCPGPDRNTFAGTHSVNGWPRVDYRGRRVMR